MCSLVRLVTLWKDSEPKLHVVWEVISWKCKSLARSCAMCKKVGIEKWTLVLPATTVIIIQHYPFPSRYLAKRGDSVRVT